eukprot:1160475-Pelagomonas_calceolata.AAC.2
MTECLPGAEDSWSGGASLEASGPRGSWSEGATERAPGPRDSWPGGALVVSEPSMGGAGVFE